jgi:hypothetical protein
MTTGSDDPNANQDFIPAVAEQFWPRGSFVKGYHTWPIHKCVYIMCLRLSRAGCTTIQITKILSDMSDRLSPCVTS